MEKRVDDEMWEWKVIHLLELVIIITDCHDQNLTIITPSMDETVWGVVITLVLFVQFDSSQQIYCNDLSCPSGDEPWDKNALEWGHRHGFRAAGHQSHPGAAGVPGNDSHVWGMPALHYQRHSGLLQDRRRQADHQPLLAELADGRGRCGEHAGAEGGAPGGGDGRSLPTFSVGRVCWCCSITPGSCFISNQLPGRLSQCEMDVGV